MLPDADWDAVRNADWGDAKGDAEWDDADWANAGWVTLLLPDAGLLTPNAGWTNGSLPKKVSVLLFE